ncbi:MAG: ABC transporter permease subunit, partial [Oscillospiraceae bacterium]
HITFNLPYVILSVLPKIRQMDMRVYEAALDLGCNPQQAFFKVVVPEISPGIITGFLMALTFSIDDFIISYFNSGHAQTLPVAIYSMARKKVSPEMYALSTIMFIIILLVLLAINFNDLRKEKNKRVKKEV